MCFLHRHAARSLCGTKDLQPKEHPCVQMSLISSQHRATQSFCISPCSFTSRICLPQLLLQPLTTTIKSQILPWGCPHFIAMMAPPHGCWTVPLPFPLCYRLSWCSSIPFSPQTNPDPSGLARLLLGHKHPGSPQRCDLGR